MKRVVIAISGASGAVYGLRLLEVLREARGIETHLVVTESAEKTLALETDKRLEEVAALKGATKTGRPCKAASATV